MLKQSAPQGTPAVTAVAPAKREVFWSESRVTRSAREQRNRHRGYIIWFTGLSGAGKSTIGRELERALFTDNRQVILLDGDNIRQGLNADLGFSRADREENIRRIGEVAKLFMETGIITITAFISPYAQDRDRVRQIVPDGDFIEVYLECSLDECEHRDTKGLYRKARAGIIKEFTGISDPYESPVVPEIKINTEELTVEQTVQTIADYLKSGGYL